jgi:hypothetical protein
MSGKWHGGKGDSRRKKANDRKYREGWDRMFKKERSEIEDGNTSRS